MFCANTFSTMFWTGKIIYFMRSSHNTQTQCSERWWRFVFVCLFNIGRISYHLLYAVWLFIYVRFVVCRMRTIGRCNKRSSNTQKTTSSCCICCVERIIAALRSVVEFGFCACSLLCGALFEYATISVVALFTCSIECISVCVFFLSVSGNGKTITVRCFR